jgi:hypothetical protein
MRAAKREGLLDTGARPKKGIRAGQRTGLKEKRDIVAWRKVIIIADIDRKIAQEPAKVTVAKGASDALRIGMHVLLANAPKRPCGLESNTEGAMRVARPEDFCAVSVNQDSVPCGPLKDARLLRGVGEAHRVCKNARKGNSCARVAHEREDDT